MSKYQNHVIDPTFFYDAINEFAFDYTLYVLTGNDEIDEYGRTRKSYTTQTIRGSLQSKGNRINRSKSGNTNVKAYSFYCKSLYRINIGDILEYQNNYFICTSVNDYDEHGVRSAELEMIRLTAYRDLAEYIKYQEGEILI